MEEQSHRPDGFDLAAFWRYWSADFESSRQQLIVRVKIHPELWGTLLEVFGEAVVPQMYAAPPPAADGWRQIELTFESPAAARTRILGLGPEAEVIEPEEMRQDILRAASETVTRYIQRSTGPHCIGQT